MALAAALAGDPGAPPPPPPLPPPPLASPGPIRRPLTAAERFPPPQGRLIDAELIGPADLAETMNRFYPERAWRLEKGGAVTLICRVEASGGLVHCGVASETPSDMGFAEAALKMAPLFRLAGSPEGLPPDAVVAIPIKFDPGE